MRCQNLSLIIALIAAEWGITLGSAAAAQPGSEAQGSRDIAAEVEALIRENVNNSQLVSFADRRRHPVRVVRGKTAAPGSTVGAPVRRPTEGDVQVVSFANPSEHPVTVLRGTQAAPVGLPPASMARNPLRDLFAPASATDLDRVAFAVDGAEFEPRRRP